MVEIYVIFVIMLIALTISVQLFSSLEQKISMGTTTYRDVNKLIALVVSIIVLTVSVHYLITIF